MENEKKCPECGCTEIGEGKLQTTLQPSNAILASSPVIAQVCTDCGYILNMRVFDPMIFKKSLI